MSARDVLGDGWVKVIERITPLHQPVARTLSVRVDGGPVEDCVGEVVAAIELAAAGEGRREVSRSRAMTGSQSLSSSTEPPSSEPGSCAPRGARLPGLTHQPAWGSP
jgi:hypothetical protein